MDKLLARIIVKTESVRDQESPAAEIARGMFTESTTAERTTTQEVSSSSAGQESGSSFSVDEEELSETDDSVSLGSRIMAENDNDTENP
jgi:hypothetical protein